MLMCPLVPPPAALFAVSGVLGLVLAAVIAVLFVGWRHRRAARLQFVDTHGGVSGAVEAPPPRAETPTNRIVPALDDPLYARGYSCNGTPRTARGVAVGVAEGLDRPDTPTRKLQPAVAVVHVTPRAAANFSYNQVVPLAGPSSRTPSFRRCNSSKRRMAAVLQ
jgi:hypothetical protein